ncbi:MAG: hypothetical protein ABMB14_14590, partial [Myxococcota bacterium]
MIDPAAALEAGGLVPVATAVPAELPTDTVDARVYAHPAIPGRVVVRLVPDAIARGVDTEMGLFGFAMTGHHDDLARQRRRSLGFPGAALVADPERARYALDVMKEFRAVAKRVASKPGHARDGFDAIADRLARQVPQFLPSFWEEVGRSFVAGGNLPYAASSFDKARAAEREYGLPIDEEHRSGAFLEFALLGALSVKALQSYGKELQKTLGGAQAYERLYTLATRRTLGGMPPWASLPKDLRSLARAAGKELAAEDRRFVAEVLGGSAIARAPASFWAEYRPAVLALAAADPAIRARLLDLFPNGGKERHAWRDDDDGWHATWMELLAESGALAAVWDLDAPAGALPSAGRAGWLVQLQRWLPSGDGWPLQLVRRAADALRADGAPVVVLQGDWRKPLDIDLVDLVCELGLPWSFGPGSDRVELGAWAAWTGAPARHGFPAERRPRDPVHAIRHPGALERLRAGIDPVFGVEAFEAIAGSLTALRELRRDWLVRQVEDLDRTGLGASAAALSRLESSTRPSQFAEFPEAETALASASIARALHRTLVTGLFDELGWTAFDRVIDALAAGPDPQIVAFRQWPYLIVGDATKLFVLGPTGIALEHDLRIGAGRSVSWAQYVGGQLYVAYSGWNGHQYEQRGYWSGSPADSFELRHAHGPPATRPIERDGAVIVGTTRIAVGDRVPPPEHADQLHDATTTWLVTPHGTAVQDRETGRVTGPGEPAFFAAGAGTQVIARAYYVVPAEVASTSPLPVLDGQYGVKVTAPRIAPAARDEGDGDGVDDEPVDAVIHQALTGDRFVGTFRHGGRWLAPTMLVRWPGAPRFRAVAEEQRHSRSAHDSSWYAADPDQPIAASVHEPNVRTAVRSLPPGWYWHYLTPRDPAGSAALRSTSLALAEQVLASGLADPTAIPSAVAAGFPEILDRDLARGVETIVTTAVDLERRLRELRAARQGGVVVERRPEIRDDEVEDALSAVRVWSYGTFAVSSAVRGLGAFLSPTPDARSVEPLPNSKLAPRRWIGRIRAIGWLGSRPGTPPAQVARVADLLQEWLDAGLADRVVRRGRLRVDRLGEWVATKDGAPLPEWQHWSDARRLVVWDLDPSGPGPWTGEAAEVALDGVFAPIDGGTWESEEIVDLRPDRAWLEALIPLLRSRGARSPTAAGLAAVVDRTGLTPPVAALVLASFPSELDKPTREALGIKLADARAATATLRDWPASMKLSLGAAVAPADPADWWDDLASARVLADAWVARSGRSIAVPAELVTLAAKELPREAAGALTRLAQGWSGLDADAAWDVSPGGDPVMARIAPGTDPFDPADLPALVAILAWVAVHLPVADPLRGEVPRTFERLVARLGNPSLWMSAGYWYAGSDPKAAEAWFDGLGGERTQAPDGPPRRVAGPLVAVRESWRIKLAFRPAGLDTTSRGIVDAFGVATGRGVEALAAYDLVHDPEFATMIARISDTPLEPGTWEQDPRRSAPEVVAAVASARGVSADAAALYLQTLTLTDPSKKNVCGWNGWTPKQYEAIGGTLVDAGLLIAGKRARAGRERFLPGGWSEETD